ncbi:putative transposase [Methyloprofundus sp.]|uniref:putative transposase n=1 Tax=Methyloprofundus sp. TaxID=2020875 RepID=UPI003D0C8308
MIISFHLPYENELKTIKEKLSQTPKHITWQELRDEDKFEQLLPGKKRLIDTVNMIAYRAETAMAALLTSPHRQSTFRWQGNYYKRCL